MITVLSLALLVGATAPQPQGLDKLRAYQGTWKMQLEQLASPFSQASHETTVLKNDCWRSAGFYACNQSVDGKSKALVVFLYDAKEDTYSTRVIPAEGGETHAGRLIIRGNVWTFPWEVTQDGKTTSFRVVNVFVTPDRIEYRQEYSSDNKQWTPIGKGVEDRLPAAP